MKNICVKRAFSIVLKISSIFISFFANIYLLGKGFVDYVVQTISTSSRDAYGKKNHSCFVIALIVNVYVSHFVNTMWVDNIKKGLKRTSADL